MEDKKKDTNVVSLGHNSNDRSLTQEQYAKLLKGYHHMMKYARQEVRVVKKFLDEAFTKYPCSNSNSRKLKDFEVHEARAYGIERADKFQKDASSKIAKLEEIARKVDIEVDFETEENPKGDE